MSPPERHSLSVTKVCGTEGCATPALLQIEGLVDGDLWVPICRFCVREYTEFGGKIRFRPQLVPIEGRREIRLKRDFMRMITEAVADEIDTDDVKEEAVERVVNDVDTDDIEEKVVEALVEEINISDLTEELFSKIIENDDFLDRIVQAVASRVLGLITEREEESETGEERISPPRVETAEDEIGGPGAAACRDCDGSIFLHRNGECPTISKEEEIPY